MSSMGEDGSWRTPVFRQSVLFKIEEAICLSGVSTPRNSLEMENHVFQKAKTREEYLAYVARLILHIREMNSKKGAGMGVASSSQGGPGVPDPKNAFVQTPATLNPLMTMGGQQQQLTARNFNMSSEEDDGSWRTLAFRQTVASKIKDAILLSGRNISRSSLEIENHVFQKAKTREEYLGYVARLILHLREMNTKRGAGMDVAGSNQGGPGVYDLINCLETLTIQGTCTPLMTMDQQQQGPMGMQHQITATNLLQNLNWGPEQSMNNVPPCPNMGMGPMPNQMDQMNAQMPNQLNQPTGWPNS